MKSFKITNKGSGYVAFNVSGKNITIIPQTTVTVDVQEKDQHVIESLKRSIIIGPSLVIEEIQSTSTKEEVHPVVAEAKVEAQEAQLAPVEETVQTVQEEVQSEVVEETIKVEDTVEVEEVQSESTEVKTDTPQKRKGGRPRKY